MLGDGSQQFHCFQILDEMLGRLNSSTNIVGIAYALSHLHKNYVLFAVRFIQQKIALQLINLKSLRDEGFETCTNWNGSSTE